MRKLFFTGLISLLPITLTIVIVIFIINLFTAPFEGSVASFLAYYDLLDKPFFFFSEEQMLYISSKLLALTAVLAIILLIGIFGRMVLANTIFHLGGKLIRRIPLVNKIYKVIQDTVTSIFEPKGTSFTQVVMVPYPTPESLTVGLLAKKQTPEAHDETVSVFIPGTPTLTGFMLTYKFEELVFIDMKVDEAIKMLISCGIMYPKRMLTDGSAQDNEAIAETSPKDSDRDA